MTKCKLMILVRKRVLLGFNIKASWICAQLALNIASLSTDKLSLMPTPKRIRAIEAVLFMLGYSIN